MGREIVTVNSNKYKVRVYCRNCDWEGDVFVPKGQEVPDSFDEECPYCGCKTLNKKW
jgi:hypothetical protein